MPKKDKVLLKDKFKTGAKPTGADFEDLLDSSVNFGESELSGGGLKLPQNERIHLSTDQKWIMTEGHLSDLIRLQWLPRQVGTGGAKPAIVWCNEQGKDKTAIISHYEANDPTRIDHRHISIETTMSPNGVNKDELFTRMEFPFDADVCEIQTHDSNFTVEGGKSRIAGEDATNKELIIARNHRKEDNVLPDGTPDYTKCYSPRWSVRGDNTSETGSNAGTDFRIVRFDDSGNALDAPLFIKRSSGNVGIGTTTPQRKLDINSDRIRIQQTKTPASATDVGLKGDICYDANFMYVCVADNTWKRTALTAW